MEELQGSLHQVVQQVDRCTEIIRNLLDFARKREPVVQAVDVNRIIEDMTMLVEKEARNNNITIDRQYDPDLPLIDSDAPQLRQVILNLLTNAAQAIGKDGTITIITRSGAERPWRSSFRTPAAASRRRIWERSLMPFFTTKPPGQGTGLGLSISHGMIQQLGGGIRVTSTVGQGTTFTITLPRQAKAEESSAMSGPRILLVDDEDRFRTNLAKMLAAQGLEVADAAGGREALELLQLEAYDVALVDLRMPGMDGLETLAQMKKSAPGLEVIMLTGPCLHGCGHGDQQTGGVRLSAEAVPAGGTAAEDRGGL